MTLNCNTGSIYYAAAVSPGLAYGSCRPATPNTPAFAAWCASMSLIVDPWGVGSTCSRSLSICVTVSLFSDLDETGGVTTGVGCEGNTMPVSLYRQTTHGAANMLAMTPADGDPGVTTTADEVTASQSSGQTQTPIPGTASTAITTATSTSSASQASPIKFRRW